MACCFLPALFLRTAFLCFLISETEIPSVQTICCQCAALYHHSSSPSLSICVGIEGVSPSQASLSSAERHCSRSVTVRPPSFHAPLALMCAHWWIMWGHSNTQLIWVELICVLWAIHWHHKHCALVCPLGLLMWMIFLKMLVKVKSVSLKHWLIAVRAVDAAVNSLAEYKMIQQTECQSLGKYFISFLLEWRWSKCTLHY